MSVTVKWAGIDGGPTIKWIKLKLSDRIDRIDYINGVVQSSDVFAKYDIYIIMYGKKYMI